jgi:hypothetical protein
VTCAEATIGSLMHQGGEWQDGRCRFPGQMNVSEAHHGGTTASRGSRIIAGAGSVPPPLRAILGLALAILVLWLLGKVVLLVFAGGLLAVLLSAPSQWLCRKTRVGYGWCLGFVLIAAVAAFAGGAYVLAPQVATQVQQVETALPQDVSRLMQDIRNSSIGHVIVDRLHSSCGAAGSALAGPVLTSISSVAAAAGSIVFVIFVGIYLAAAPRYTRKGCCASCHRSTLPARARSSSRRFPRSSISWRAGCFR